VHQPRILAHTNVRLHIKVQLVAFFRLVYLRIACVRFVFSRAWCSYQGNYDTFPDAIRLSRTKRLRRFCRVSRRWRKLEEYERQRLNRLLKYSPTQVHDAVS